MTLMKSFFLSKSEISWSVKWRQNIHLIGLLYALMNNTQENTYPSTRYLVHSWYLIYTSWAWIYLLSGPRKDEIRRTSSWSQLVRFSLHIIPHVILNTIKQLAQWFRQGLGKLFLQRSDSKYFWLCTPYRLSQLFNCAIVVQKQQ